MNRTVDCPTCGKPVPWRPQSKWRPFCSERCRLIDLGDWFDERQGMDRQADPGPLTPPSDGDSGLH